MLVILITVALGAAFLICWVLMPDKRLKELGNKIPGPKPYPLVGNIFNFNLIGIYALEDWKNCMKKYGNTFRFWLGPQLHLFISEPDDIQMLLTSATLITKADTYHYLDCWLGTGLLLSTGELWQRRRKAITPTFHFKMLEEFVPIFNKCANTLVKVLKDKIPEGFFPLTDLMSNCALDAIAETAMGTELKAQTNPIGEYPSSIMKMTTTLMEKISNPLLGMEPFYTLSGRRGREKHLLKILFTLPIEVLKKKEKETNFSTNSSTPEDSFGIKKRAAFLEYLLKLKHENVPAFETEKDVMDEVVTFMFEGHDTTTMALTFAVWNLGVHQEIQEELYQEVSGILVREEQPTLEDYQKMPYLERVIKETLRLYPSAPMIARLATHDVVLPSNGYTIPKGAQVNIMIMPLHRREDFFPDPEKFDPDRFLEPQKHPYAYIPFSAGPRNCIGQRYAMLDVKVILSNLVLNYKIESDKDIIVSPEMILRSRKGPNIRLIPRN